MPLAIKVGKGTSSSPPPRRGVDRVRPLEPVAPVTGRSVYVGFVPVGWAALISDDDRSLAVLTELGDDAPRVTQGYGGWEEVDRRGRTSLTHWTGFKPMGIELDLTFDDLDAGKSVETAVDILEALAGRGRRRPAGGPPPLIVDTASVMAHDVRTDPDTRWVITDLEFDDDETIVNHAGNRVRVDVTVHLLQHVSDKRLQDRAAAARQRNKSRKKNSATRRYTVKQGDTLQKIARAKLGDAGRWTQIAKLNGLRDPRAVKPGQVIRLP
jgi:LysM repeat protein